MNHIDYTDIWHPYGLETVVTSPYSTAVLILIMVKWKNTFENLSNNNKKVSVNVYNNYFYQILLVLPYNS